MSQTYRVIPGANCRDCIERFTCGYLEGEHPHWECTNSLVYGSPVRCTSYQRDLRVM